HHQVDDALDRPARVDRRDRIADLRDRPAAGAGEQHPAGPGHGRSLEEPAAAEGQWVTRPPLPFVLREGGRWHATKGTGNRRGRRCQITRSTPTARGPGRIRTRDTRVKSPLL